MSIDIDELPERLPEARRRAHDDLRPALVLRGVEVDGSIKIRAAPVDWRGRA